MLIPTRSILLWSDQPDVYVRAAEAAGLTASFKLETVTFPTNPSDDVLARAEAMLAWRPAKGLATRAPKLRWIHSLTGGCEHWLASPDLPRQVVLTCARGSHVPQMPEHIFAGLFVASKDIPGIVLDQRERHWRRRVNDTLAGQTLGILGLGAIGCEVARKAAAFDMRVIGTKRAPGPVPHVAQVFGADGNERVLAEADYVLLLLPATTETRGMINTRTLGLMKPGAWLLNFGRGDLVVDADLVAAVSAGRIAGAVLDVFVQEPLPESSPLWTTENIVIFPHVGGLHPQRDDLVAKLWVQNLRRFAAGEPLRDVVDPARGY